MKTVWASLYDQFGHQYGGTFTVKGDDVYEEIKAQLRNTEDIADYGVYDDEEVV